MKGETYDSGDGNTEGGSLLVGNVVGSLDLEVALDGNVLGESAVNLPQSIAICRRKPHKWPLVLSTKRKLTIR